MGLLDVFKKKDCEICGKEVGMFGYKKLEDGEICKECVKLLSPWFDDRRHSTVEQINQQLAYRKQNREALDAFRPVLSYGEQYTLWAELENGVPVRFLVARYDDYMEENADIVSFRDVTSFNIDVRDNKRELTHQNKEGEDVSYNPPRYEYSYDFYVEIHVNHPYFDEICFALNRDTVSLETVERTFGIGMPRGFDPMLYPEYRQYRSVCDELEELFRAGMQGMALPSYAPEAQPVVQPAPVPQPIAEHAPAGPKFCPNCGAPADGGKFCRSCGSRLQ